MSKKIKKFWRQVSYFFYKINVFRYLKNWLFCLRYPFWRATNSWTGVKLGYNTTWYESINKGWRKAFGRQLSADIKAAGLAHRKAVGKKVPWKEMLQWQQIKEKWGELRLYASAAHEISEVLDKYELLSICYCNRCGKPARYVTKGWVEYCCEKCYDKLNTGSLLADSQIADRKKKDRLTKKDIPHGVRYTKSKNGKLISHAINYKKAYGIDYAKMWGLEK